MEWTSAKLTLCLLAILVIPVLAISTSRGEALDVQVRQNIVTVTAHLVFMENLTVLPRIHLFLDNSNGTILLTPLNAAIQKQVPTARANIIQLRATTSNVSRAWSLIEDYSLTVSGANSNLGSTVSANLAFVSMNMSQPVVVNGTELNALGSAYLLSPLNAQPRLQTLYFIDESQTLTATIPAETTKRFSLLDFSWVPPIATWNTTRDLLRQQTKWTYDPTLPRYNLTLGHRSPEGTGVLNSTYAVYEPSFDVIVPANARSVTNTISFDVPASTEIIMPIILVAVTAVLVGVLIIDRRITGIGRMRKKRES